MNIASNEIGNRVFDTGQIKNRASRGYELYQYIDITICSILTSCHRTKHSGMIDTKSTQQFAMLRQNCKNFDLAHKLTILI